MSMLDGKPLIRIPFELRRFDCLRTWVKVGGNPLSCNAILLHGLKVTQTPFSTARPKFTARPRDVRIGLNGVAKFECAASGNPRPEIVWRKEGSTQYFLSEDPNPRVQLQGPEGILRIQGVKREDAGVYVCSALSAAGSRNAVARLEVTSQDQVPPPVINILPTNQTLPIKSMATIPCEIGASMSGGGVGVKWLKNGMELEFDAEGQNGGRISVAANGTLHIGGEDLCQILSFMHKRHVYFCISRSEINGLWSIHLRCFLCFRRIHGHCLA